MLNNEYLSSKLESDIEFAFNLLASFQEKEFLEFLICKVQNETNIYIVDHSLSILWKIYSYEFVSDHDYMYDCITEEFMLYLFNIIKSQDDNIFYPINIDLINDILSSTISLVNNIIVTSLNIQNSMLSFPDILDCVSSLLIKTTQSNNILTNGTKLLQTILTASQCNLKNSINQFIDVFYMHILINDSPCACSILGLFYCMKLDELTSQLIIDNDSFLILPTFLNSIDENVIQAIYLFLSQVLITISKKYKANFIKSIDWMLWSNIDHFEQENSFLIFIYSSKLILDQNWELSNTFFCSNIFGKVLHLASSCHYEYKIRKKSFSFTLNYAEKFSTEQTAFLIQNGFIDTIYDFISASSNHMFTLIIEYLNFLLDLMSPLDQLFFVSDYIEDKLMNLIESRHNDTNTKHQIKIFELKSKHLAVLKYLDFHRQQA